MIPLHAELSAEGTCVIKSVDIERWRVSLPFGDALAWNPFREALLWPRAQLVVAAAGDRVHLLELETGNLRATLDLSPDHFGHLALVTLPDTDLLLVLGWTDIRAYDSTATLRWHARNVAVDGITFDSSDASTLRVHAEMDPPGGWFAVSLDPTTGRELDRQPAFLPGYVGRHGQGPDSAS